MKQLINDERESGEEFERNVERTEQLDEVGEPWGNGKLLCEITRRDELKGHGNLANGKNRSRTSALLDRAKKMGNTYSNFPRGKFSSREGKAMKSINSRFSVTRVPPR